MGRSLSLRGAVAPMACTSDTARHARPGCRPRGARRTPRWRHRFPRHEGSRGAGVVPRGIVRRSGPGPVPGCPATPVRVRPAPARRGIVRRMRLPFEPPVEPMLAKASDGLPDGDGWLFEPKWDGFRALVFRDGDEIYTQSRDLKPLDRYFPELAEPLKANIPERCVLDGEVVIAQDGALAFESLLLR